MATKTSVSELIISRSLDFELRLWMFGNSWTVQLWRRHIPAWLTVIAVCTVAGQGQLRPAGICRCHPLIKKQCSTHCASVQSRRLTSLVQFRGSRQCLASWDRSLPWGVGRLYKGVAQGPSTHHPPASLQSTWPETSIQSSFTAPFLRPASCIVSSLAASVLRPAFSISRA